jgi:nicotinate-nucleotide pyrophosphorylase (carboxylating)
MSCIPPHLLQRLVREALDEDLGPGDLTTDSLIPPDVMGRATIEARQDLVVAGIEAARASFRIMDPECTILRSTRDGKVLRAGETLLELTAHARALLSAERTALNFLAHLSGVATSTKQFVEAAGRGEVAITDTRKTTPGLRLLEKAAVTAGGGDNHRFGLWDAVLIKDNHVDLSGGIQKAVSLARHSLPPGVPVETEVRNLGELDEALEAGADAVLLDNFPTPRLREAVSRAHGRALIEVSGRVSLESLAEIAALGVARISIGSLTHSAPAADLTMRIEPWTT